MGYWRVLHCNLEDKPKPPFQNLVFLHIFTYFPGITWSSFVVFAGFPRKWRFSFLPLRNSYLQVAWYFEMFCRIFKYSAKCTSSEIIYWNRLNSIVHEPGFISGKIICEKKQSPIKITFSWETGQLMPTWRRGKHGDMALFTYDGSWSPFYICFTSFMKSN